MNSMLFPGPRERSEPSNAQLAEQRVSAHAWLSAQLLTAVATLDDRNMPFTGRPACTASEVIADNIAGPIRVALFKAMHYAIREGFDSTAAIYLREAVRLAAEDYALCHAEELIGQGG